MFVHLSSVLCGWGTYGDSLAGLGGQLHDCFSAVLTQASWCQLIANFPGCHSATNCHRQASASVIVFSHFSSDRSGPLPHSLVSSQQQGCMPYPTGTTVHCPPANLCSADWPRLPLTRLPFFPFMAWGKHGKKPINEHFFLHPMAASLLHCASQDGSRMGSLDLPQTKGFCKQMPVTYRSPTPAGWGIPGSVY